MLTVRSHHLSLTLSRRQRRHCRKSSLLTTDDLVNALVELLDSQVDKLLAVEDLTQSSVLRILKLHRNKTTPGNINRQVSLFKMC